MPVTFVLMLLGDTFMEPNELEFDAVKKLHIHLDDDKDGDVDFSESEEVSEYLNNFIVTYRLIIYFCL